MNSFSPRTANTPLILPPVWLIWLTLITLSAVAAWAAGGEAGKGPLPGKTALPGKYLDTVRAELRSLSAELERLQEEIVGDPKLKERGVYPMTVTALGEVARLERAVRTTAASQDALLKEFARLDSQVRQLSAALRKGDPMLRRSADYLDVANEELYFALAGGSNQQLGRVTERQAHAFTEAALDLERTAKFALAADAADRAVLIDNVAKLALAAERFEKLLQNQADLKQRQGDFADVDKAWGRVVDGLALLRPAENVHLLRNAARIDRLHERLFRLLQIKGKRTSLSVQS